MGDARSTDIQAFLALHQPFDLLPGGVLESVSRSIDVEDVRRGAVLMTPGEPVEALKIVRSGAVEIRDSDGQLLAHLEEGESFGARALLRGGQAIYRGEAIDDGSICRLPAAAFHQLCRDHPSFAYHFAAAAGGGPPDALGGGLESKRFDFSTERVGTLLIRGPVTVSADTPIHQAAGLMRGQSVSCLMVTEGDELVGIVTDRDLRNRVVAERLPYDRPVEAVMRRQPYRIRTTDYAVDALFLMLRHNIHHLPVVDGNALVGCLTATTLIEKQTNSPFFLARAIRDADAPEQLKEAVAGLLDVVVQMVALGNTALSIGHVVSMITDAINVRLLELAEAEFGPPPIPYLWLAAGSQGRREQTARSDQDNCIIVDDAYDDREHGAYFRDLSRFVCDGLNACGYAYCPGEVMAMTDKWRQPLSVWRRYFTGWIEEPEPMALMLSSVFFDLRPVRGDRTLFDDLQGLILTRAKNKRIFQSYMATNALTHEPPLGFFRNFVLIRGGEHNHTLDLKHSGVVPIIDLARLYALAAGAPEVNTHERLTAAGAAGMLSQQGVADLKDALEFIGFTRLRHQARLIREGKPADNYVSPADLSSRDRSYLKSAFRTVKTMQAVMAARYQTGHF